METGDTAGTCIQPLLEANTAVQLPGFAAPSETLSMALAAPPIAPSTSEAFQVMTVLYVGIGCLVLFVLALIILCLALRQRKMVMQSNHMNAQLRAERRLSAGSRKSSSIRLQKSGSY